MERTEKVWDEINKSAAEEGDEAYQRTEISLSSLCQGCKV